MAALPTCPQIVCNSETLSAETKSGSRMSLGGSRPGCRSSISARDSAGHAGAINAQRPSLMAAEKPWDRRNSRQNFNLRLEDENCLVRRQVF